MFFSLIPKGTSNGGFSKLFVANHDPSSTVVFVKQTNVDNQDNDHLDQIKVRLIFNNNISISPTTLKFLHKNDGCAIKREVNGIT